MYFCPYPETREKLNIIKMRNSRVSLAKAMNALKHKKYGQTRNNPNFTDTYLDLFYFESPNLKLFHTIIQKVMDFNQAAWYRSAPMLYIFFEKLLKQVSAATMIQMNFRAYLARKLNAHKPLFIDQLVTKRAIY